LADKKGMIMTITPELVDELNVILLYSLETTQEGIKVHKNADPAKIAAVKRLFNKALVTQEDGGYLTDLGRELAEHVESSLRILTSA
jgi:uncharacterized protein (TIGR02647 family)